MHHARPAVGQVHRVIHVIAYEHDARPVDHVAIVRHVDQHPRRFGLLNPLMEHGCDGLKVQVDRILQKKFGAKAVERHGCCLMAVVVRCEDYIKP